MEEAKVKAANTPSSARAVLTATVLNPESVGSDTLESAASSKKLKSVSLCELFKFADKWDGLLFVVGAISSIVNGAFLPLFAIVLGSVFDDFNTVEPSKILSAGDKYGALFAYLAAGTLVASFGQICFFTIMSERLTLRIRTLYLNAILQQDIPYFDCSKTGELTSKIAENTIVIREALGEKLGALFQFSSMFLVGVIIGFVYDWKLTLVIMSASPLLAAGGYFMMKLMEDQTSGGLGMYAEAGAIAEEAFNMIRTVSAYALEGRISKRYKAKLKVAEEYGCKKAQLQGISMGAVFGVYFMCYALGFWYGTQLVINNREEAVVTFPPNATANSFCFYPQTVTPAQAFLNDCMTGGYEGSFDLANNVDVCNCGVCVCGCNHPDANCLSGGDITLVFFSVLIGCFALGQAGPSVGALTNAKGAAATVYEIIDRKPEIDASSTEGRKLGEISGQISFQNVAFKYPTREIVVFSNLNLEIEAGKTTAFTGGSGAGKSTLNQLVQRFYDPIEGSILLDGVNLKDLNLHWLRSNIGLVGQEPVLFACSVAENIAYGVTSDANPPTIEEIHEAAKLANAYDFISDMPDGFDTFVGERGSVLSGGQKQRIAIARALIRRPKILILDEATAALDNQSERVVQEALDKLMKDSSFTTLVTAHRLSTIKNADKIVVMGEQKVLEQGTHDELLALSGHYSALVQASLRSQEGDDADLKDLMNRDESLRERFGSSQLSETRRPPSSSANNAENDDDEEVDEIDELDPVVKRLESEVEAKEEVAVNTKGCCGFFKKSGKNDEKTKKKKVAEELYTVPTSRVFEFSTPETYWYIPAGIAAALNGVTMPLFALLFTNITTVYFLPTTALIQDQSNIYSLAFLGLGIGVALCYFFQFWCFGVIGERMTARVRYTLFRKLLSQEIGFFDMKKNSVGSLTSKLAQDAAIVKASLADRLGLMTMNVVTLIAGLVIAFSFGWELTLILLCTLPLLVLSGMLQMQAMGGMAKEDDKALAEASQVLTESIGNIRTVTAFALKDRLVALYDEQLGEVQKLGRKKGAVAGAGFGFSQCVMFAVYAIAFFAGSRLMVNNGYTFKDVLGVFMALTMIGMAMGQNASMAPDIAKAGVSISNVFRILDRPSKIDPFNEEGSTEVLNNDIVFKDVEFRYPSRKDVKVFDKVNATIRHGQKVGLVGYSGSGKSTTVGLIERFYDPEAGSMEFFGVDAKKRSLHWMRSQIGMVEQEPRLFGTTIFENIAYGMPQSPQQDLKDCDTLVTEEEVTAAAKAANAHDFIMSFPDGYQTQVTSSSLSGGQRQRLSLARCLIRKPKVFLLDEATSALDETSQKIVQESLDRILEENKEATAIIVAHRLSTLAGADLLLVFDHGVVVESGTHEELMGMKGVYYKLYQVQSKEGH